MTAARKYVIFFLFPLALNLPAQPGYSQSSTISNPSNPGIQRFLRINEVNAKAARHFEKHFIGDGSEKWTILDGFYIASFSQGAVRTEAFYTSRGGFAYTVKYYPAAFLKEDIKLAILKKFQDHFIDIITEISNLNDKLYYIKIKSNSNIKMVKVIGNEMEITEDYANGGT
jgi:hypothetical protein